MNDELILQPIVCPLCASEDYRPYATFRDWIYQIGGEFQAVKCAGCKHVYLNPAPTPETIFTAYPQSYRPYHLSDDAQAGARTPDAQPCDAQTGGSTAVSRDSSTPHSETEHELGENRRSSSIKSWLRPLWHAFLDDHSTFVPRTSTLKRSLESTAPSGLEIGCADGWFSEKLLRQGWQMKAIEPSESAAALATKRGISVQCTTIDRAELSPESFDCCYSWMVLEHLANPRDALRSIHRWLKPNGLYAFSIPNLRSLDRIWFSEFWLGYDGPRHLQHFTPNGIKRLLREERFEIEQFYFQPNLQYWFGSWAAKRQARGLSDDRTKQAMQTFQDGLDFRKRVLLQPLAQVLCLTGLAGRMTVVARKA